MISRTLPLVASVLIAATCALATTRNIATTPISRMQEGWWRARFDAKQRELRTETVDVMWLGDSITQNWEKDSPEPWLQYRPVWDRLYDASHSINLGFKGDSTCHLLWRLMHGELDGVHPKVVVLLIGANNFGHVHTDADQTFAGIETIIALLRDRLPAAHIILVAVLPSIRSAWVDENTKRLNARLAAASSGQPGLTFVDATHLFIKDGHVDPAQFIDPKLHPPEPALHPTAQAQAELAHLLEPTIKHYVDAPTR